MKRFIGLLAGLVLFGNSGLGLAAEEAAPLANLDFHVGGVGLEAGSEHQAVPKGIATRVDTGIDAQGFDVKLIISQLPRDCRVKAELTGPAFQTPLTLTTLPGKPFDSSNFTACEFTAGIATESGQVPLKQPVIIPIDQASVNPVNSVAVRVACHA